ncbi:type VII secretion integral membrane protein EccD [Aeromicrobium sp. SMF47]|uniref:type VII secretion integral membrane protein EccD n=1 Tax=Aeromicrobium TaxID=2040 RepID=UPI00129DC48E|nr:MULTISPECIES: type VII secretion integral membrane protein EccD [Aeromicrobium]MRJ75985.1 type VII secretion integral membrane protein EccD [Aeromicrobium yanjiei]MRK00335.1 type VII secretion integral membrane protein EccD [Aeromicrobium sp. S22]
MTSSTAVHSLGGLVRVTIASGDRRTDLALPSSVTVAELLPELARSMGVLEPGSAHTGFRLLAADGTQLSTSAGLAFQNVYDGAVLTLAPGIDETPRVYDDVVEAMSDVIEETTRPWEPTAARNTALIASGSLLALGALSIGVERTSILAGALAGAIALVLLTASIVVSRLEHENEIALMLGWSAVVYAAVGAFTAVSSDEILGAPLASAGGAGAVTAILAMAGLESRRLLMLPGVILGVIAAAASGLVIATDLEPAKIYLVALALAVIASGVQPALALTSAGASSPQPEDPASLPDDPSEVDIEKVRTGARVGHDVLLATTVTSGLLLIAVAPLAVTLGLTGMLTTVAAAVALLVRTRQFRSGTEVGAGLLTAAAGILSIAISVLVLEPDWRPGLIVVLIVVAAGTLVSTLVTSTRTVSRGRMAEVLELIALVAIVPLLVIAIGIVSAVRS